jgi:hypothetical protein
MKNPVRLAIYGLDFILTEGLWGQALRFGPRLHH